ncbi:chemotaxis protein CheW [Rhizobium sp. CFBP 13717]|nr:MULTISPECIES: chemotaxis protein CheW [unclassified Rhizobium]MBD8689577.1 chemotaxis protein CheW [Rhizobium sp. CFBP 13644]MBD8693901.1 chemotaxis protein CheW [Rhizobium sp. CFBP 13717]
MKASPAADAKRHLIFRVGEKNYEVNAGLVREIIRVPHITRVPRGPKSLKGIANLRGLPIPVLSMDQILNGGSKIAQDDAKIIIYDHGGWVGLLVDDVIRLSGDNTATSLQDLSELLDVAFMVARRAPVERAGYSNQFSTEQASAKLRPLLSFRVAGQLYGLPLQYVREVTAFGGDLAVVPSASDAVIGLIAMRESVLPLVSLASLMGLDPLRSMDSSSRIVIIESDGELIGLVVDEMDVIHRLDEQAIDAVPAVLQRGRGDAQIEAIGRIAEGGMLISILSPEKLFGHHAVAHALSQNTGAKSMETKAEQDDAVEQFLIFQLGKEHYGLPVGSVDEVIRVPGEITRVPGVPAFVMGVINLRGKAIPLIDQRRRFDTPNSTQSTKARAIVVTLGALQAGFVVDAVSELKAVPLAALSAAPEFSSEQTGVFDRIAHIEAEGRMILLVDPQELLTRAERDVVAAIAHQETAVAV